MVPAALGLALVLMAGVAAAQSVPVSAKIISSEGVINAVDSAGQRRPLTVGANVFPGDVIETGRTTQTVLAFRDDTRVTLGEATRFRVDSFSYDAANAGQGRFLVSVLRGSMRALTGLIGKSNNRNVSFATATATIGIRGTGVDISCTGACAGEAGGAGSGTGGLTVSNWSGIVEVNIPGQPMIVLQVNEGVVVSSTGIQSVTGTQLNNLIRPDLLTVPPNLFTTGLGGNALTGALATGGLAIGTITLSRTVLKNKSISSN
ncbi:MAG: FecR domain-containing protein [Ramlibacter sp.]